MGQQGGANAPYTRFRGPILVGQSSDFGIAAVNGGSTAPLISFWNASEHGFYVTSTAESRYVAAGSPVIFTSGGLKVGSTSFQASTGVIQVMVIPQTTGNLSSAAAPPAATVQLGAALVFQHSNSTGTGHLWIYSTISGWMTSTAPFTSTSTGGS